MIIFSKSPKLTCKIDDNSIKCSSSIKMNIPRRFHGINSWRWCIFYCQKLLGKQVDGPFYRSATSTRPNSTTVTHLFKIRRAATLTYVTAMVCDRGKFCGGRTIIIGRRKLRPYGRRSKCDLGISRHPCEHGECRPILMLINFDIVKVFAV